jgi:heat shock protein HslJ
MGVRPPARLFAPAAAVVCLFAALPVLSGDLTGTSWRLVNIASMDDRVHVPEKPSHYTLEFRTDGAAAILADCNRATGVWASEAPGQLRFGPVAATGALCEPGSLSEMYLAQFEWVRSYVLQDGRLFLATMADGSIIEFEPLGGAPLAATVLGEEVRTADANEMQQTILSRLFDDYAATHGIEVTDAEIESFTEKLKRGSQADALTAENDLTPEDAARIDAMRREMARSMIRQWKINRQLYRAYGGRVIYQQLGPEPLDAYRQFFEERRQAGAFTIHEKAFEGPFWRYFTDDSMHSFVAPGSEASAFEVPPWEK